MLGGIFGSKQQVSAVESRQNVEPKQGFLSGIFKSVKRIFTKEDQRELNTLKSVVSKPDFDIYEKKAWLGANKKDYAGFMDRASTLQDKRSVAALEMSNKFLEADADIYGMSAEDVEQTRAETENKIRGLEAVIAHGDSAIYTESEAQLPKQHKDVRFNSESFVRNEECKRLHRGNDYGCSE